MAVFIFTTKLSYTQLFKWGHSKTFAHYLVFPKGQFGVNEPQSIYDKNGEDTYHSPGIIHVGIIDGIAWKGAGFFYNYMVCTLFFDIFFVGLFEGREIRVHFEILPQLSMLKISSTINFEYKIWNLELKIKADLLLWRITILKSKVPYLIKVLGLKLRTIK